MPEHSSREVAPTGTLVPDWRFDRFGPLDRIHTWLPTTRVGIRSLRGVRVTCYGSVVITVSSSLKPPNIDRGIMLRPALTLAVLAALAAPTRPSEPGPAPAPKKTVAILYFDNHTGSPDNDPLGKGISSMMISDLSSVKEIQIVERERMQDLIKEQDLQHTRYFDSTTAVKTGRMIGAEYVVVGAFATVKPQMRIDTRVVRVETGEVVKTAQVTGDEDKFFDLEQALADKLIDGLGLALSPEEKSEVAAQQKANRIDDVSTMTSYSQALALFDQKDYAGAVVEMGPAVAASPKSMLLRVAFSDMKKRAAATVADKAKEKIKAGLGGFFKRPLE